MPDPLSERFLDSSEEVGRSMYRVFTPGPAFGGDEEEKAAQLARAVERRDGELRPSSSLWGPWVPRGVCALQGVLVGAYQPVIPPDKARELAVRIVEATPVGADLRRVWWRWFDWAFRDATPCIEGRLLEEGLTELATAAGSDFSVAATQGPEVLEENEWKALRRDCWIERYARGVGTLEWESSYALWAVSSAAYPDERSARYAARYALRAGVVAEVGAEYLVELLALAPQWEEVPA